MFTGLKFGNCTNPCFLCDWQQDTTKKKDGQVKNVKYSTQACNPREKFEMGKLGVKGDQLVKPESILFAPLHIKIGLVTQFVLSLDKDGDAIKFLKRKFPKYSSSKIEHGIFDGSQIRKIFNDSDFEKMLSKAQLRGWNALVSVCTKFLGNFRAPNYVELVDELKKSFEELNIKETVKLHFLIEHLDYFPANCGKYSDEQGEHFHQEIAQMEKRYSRPNKTMLADYVWTLKKQSDYEFSYIK